MTFRLRLAMKFNFIDYVKICKNAHTQGSYIQEKNSTSPFNKICVHVAIDKVILL